MSALSSLRSSDPSACVLDNPIWQALTTRQAHLATVTSEALLFPSNISPLMAFRDDPVPVSADVQIGRGRRMPLMSFDVDGCEAPDGFHPVSCTRGVQMVAHRVLPGSLDVGIVHLGDADASQIYDLAQRTQPGPFAQRTATLGTFIGIKDQGQLIAMAGQRLKLPGYVEISAVCVDAAYRGRGLGAALVCAMAQIILAKGEVPFLHAYADNKAAIALYERLGFSVRTTLSVRQYATLGGGAQNSQSGDLANYCVGAVEQR